MLSDGLRRLILRTHPVLSRLLPARHVPYPFPGGRVYLNLRESPMMLARVLGLYETDKTRFLRSRLKPGMTFVDVGANKGDFSLIAARAVGDAGRVLAFEPEPENCRWIRESIALNGYRNIALHQAALGDRDGEAELFLGEKSGWHSLRSDAAGRAGGSIRVPIRTLDAVLVESGDGRVDVVKIDVEGAELQVLRGASRTLGPARAMAVVVDIHPQLGVDSRDVCEQLRLDGFSLSRLSTPDRPLSEIPRDLDEVLAVKNP